MSRSARRIGFEAALGNISRPGIDPRTWTAMARVDDHPDAIVWDSDLGWIVDVTIVTGALAGEGPVTCRVASVAQGAGCGVSCPVRADSLVLVDIPGDPNEDAVIVGQVHDLNHKAPTTINGETITEEFALETHIFAFPDEDLDQEWRNVRITADEMIFGTPDADQPFARGDDLADALDDLADALRDFCQSLISATPAAPNGALTVASAIAAATPLVSAIASFKATRQQYLSTRIKGD